ncbi:Flp pilus assembly protein CpaB [Nesterenkonia sp. LB17]|uniref:Flp pilus assembly protein CpaB n=1 Tax=Nesterenkonia sp. LB17 TaxID=2901230 RepID=UPI001F4C5588|nr:Flp pilus assembly protein CpaB [Nesterenkonia sp. LB17]MCH8566097.1 Flp pilus assembly protein CpaB [Nesterenkonia sp. LB17]
MSRRLIAALAAVVLAALAAVLVISYVNQADDRAMADMSPETVMVVTEAVPEGTPVEEMGEFVGTDEVPSAAVVPAGIGSLEEVAGQVTIAPLYPGEQLVAERFASPEDLEGAGEVEIPQGFHEITVQLPTTRVVGGHLNPGDTVGFFVSLTEPQETQLTLQKVLVTRVQGGVTETVEEDGTETTTPAADTLMVTLAVEATDAKIVAHAAEFHGIWLSLEPEDGPEDDTDPVEVQDMLR